MKKYPTLIEYVFRFSIPFIALLISHFIFKISDLIKPINDIDEDSIKWAFDLAFSTALLTIGYEILKSKLTPNFNYTISIHDKRNQNSVVLDSVSAMNVLTVKCSISIQKKKQSLTIPNMIEIHYPKWITLEIDNYDSIDDKAVTNMKDKYVVTIDPNYIFNSNIVNDESYVLNLKIATRVISDKYGDIEAFIRKKHVSRIDSVINNFSIEILQEG